MCVQGCVEWDQTLKKTISISCSYHNMSTFSSNTKYTNTHRGVQRNSNEGEGLDWKGANMDKNKVFLWNPSKNVSKGETVPPPSVHLWTHTYSQAHTHSLETHIPHFRAQILLIILCLYLKPNSFSMIYACVYRDDCDIMRPKKKINHHADTINFLL